MPSSFANRGRPGVIVAAVAAAYGGAMRGHVTMMAAAVVLAACSGGGGDGAPTSTLVVTTTEPSQRLAGVPEAEVESFLADELSVAADVVATQLERGVDGYAGAFEVVLDDPSEARATVACEELSVFLASHPTVTGVSRIVVSRRATSATDPVDVVVNDGVRPGDPGACVPA